MSTALACFKDVFFHTTAFRLRSLLLIITGSLLLTISSSLSLPLPFTPIPFVLTSHLSLALGAILGKNRGTAAVFFYLVQGALGLPVFALKKSSLLHLMGPSGGFLWGYLLGAYVVGHLLHSRRLSIYLCFTLGTGIIYLLGWVQLATFLGWSDAFFLGILPFVAIDLGKILFFSQGSAFFLPKK